MPKIFSSPLVFVFAKYVTFIIHEKKWKKGRRKREKGREGRKNKKRKAGGFLFLPSL